jgi:hypothetical protein
MVHYDDGAGTLSITAFNTVITLTGDFNIARIEFGAVGDPCDIGLLDIDDSELFTADTMPDSVSHTTNNGYASICPDDPGCSNGDCDGDMDGNGATNSADVRYLAKHIAGDPLYAILHAEGDVNCVGGVNSADVRHLALFIAGDPSYTPLCPVC